MMYAGVAVPSSSSQVDLVDQKYWVFERADYVTVPGLFQQHISLLPPMQSNACVGARDPTSPVPLSPSTIVEDGRDGVFLTELRRLERMKGTC